LSKINGSGNETTAPPWPKTLLTGPAMADRTTPRMKREEASAEPLPSRLAGDAQGLSNLGPADVAGPQIVDNVLQVLAMGLHRGIDGGQGRKQVGL
jgi:hypothetical protein